jgi:hypothetical protein
LKSRLIPNFVLSKKNQLMFKRISLFYFIILLPTLFSCHQKIADKADFVIAKGQIPDLAKDENGNIHLVFGLGDSIMYSRSSDNGNSFSSPSVVAMLPNLFSFAMRGPQIAATDKGLVITACTSKGNISSFYFENGKWQKGARVNDEDSVAKEGLMALAAEGNHLFAVWLDLRGNKRNKIYGAESTDGGKSWSKNIMVYTSPDTGVCPCCKPSVVMKNNHVYVMFRNWLDGNRNLYVIESANGGNTFGVAQKAGTGNWKLDGCPMDGGGLAVNNNGDVQTVWRREDDIFADVPGLPETLIGKGKNCTIATVNNENIYAWTNNGNIVLTKSNSPQKIVGKGSLPVVKALDDQHAVCVWQDDNKIHGAVVAL